MTEEEILKNARKNIGKYCKACPVCNGKACGNQIPGPGAKGFGDTAIRNFDAWRNIRVKMDTINDEGEVDTKTKLFGREFAFPVFAGPAGSVSMHYSDMYTDVTYNDALVTACSEENVAAFTGDGMDESVMIAATNAIKKNDGNGVPTVKPWSMEIVREKIKLVNKSNAFAVAMDIDAAGLPFLKNMNPPSGSKNVRELKEIINMTNLPFIVKGVMTVKGAIKAKEAGASAIVVSNHGGRVLDQCQATAEVLEEIVDAVSCDMKVFVDGGIRYGSDVFKALAMGADGVLICRPIAVSVYGGGKEGVKLYMNKIRSELIDTMQMCGALTIDDITRDMIWKEK